MAEGKPLDTTAPYGSWTTFKGFIGELKKKGAPPPRIDSSVLSGKAGSAQRDIKSALRFFSLTKGDELAVTQAFRVLIDAHGDKERWPMALGILLGSYDALTAALDLNTATQQQLEDALGQSGLEGREPKVKAARFYLSVNEEAGVKLSPHFKKTRPGAGGRSVGGGKTRNKKNGGLVSEETADQDSEQKRKLPERTTEIKPLPDSEFAVLLPDDMESADIVFAVEHLIGFLRLRKRWVDGVTLTKPTEKTTTAAS